MQLQVAVQPLSSPVSFKIHHGHLTHSSTEPFPRFSRTRCSLCGWVHVSFNTDPRPNPSVQPQLPPRTAPPVRQVERTSHYCHALVHTPVPRDCCSALHLGCPSFPFHVRLPPIRSIILQKHSFTNLLFPNTTALD